ncbi:MAG: MaoC family dehydratase [Candidatus Obscuribacterales bacterium]|nr:MaoC family dehydratase [Candidatus Obscuribacterales bacterium]
MQVSVKVSALKELIGRELGPSSWILIDQKRINDFADVTEDHQWIHVNPERCAAESPFKTTIAHGYLTLSLIPGLLNQILKIEDAARLINFGANKIRFQSAVPVNSKVRVRQKVVSVENKRVLGQLMTSEITVDIEGQEKPALIIEMLSLIA